MGMRVTKENPFVEAARNKTQIIADAAGNAGGVTMYTVPANKVAYITSASVSIQVNWNVGTSSAFAEIRAWTANEKLIALKVGAQQLTNVGWYWNTGTNSLTFPMPLKYTAGETIKIRNTSGTSHGTITGWEESA